jgi:hypothetical protein
MRKYEVLKVPHPDLPAGAVVGEKIQLNDYPKECALVEGGFLKSLNEHS